MRHSNHTDAEIVSLLKEAEAGVPIQEICATAYVSTRTFYRWRKQFGGLAPDAVRRLRVLELENQHLRLLVGRLSRRDTGGVWSGWTQDDPNAALDASVENKVGAAPAPAERAGRHCGSGASSGRFASLRAGRC